MEVLKGELVGMDVQQACSELVADVPTLTHLLDSFHQRKDLLLVKSLPVLFELSGRLDDLRQKRVVKRFLGLECIGLYLRKGFENRDLITKRKTLRCLLRNVLLYSVHEQVLKLVDHLSAWVVFYQELHYLRVLSCVLQWQIRGRMLVLF